MTATVDLPPPPPLPDRAPPGVLADRPGRVLVLLFGAVLTLAVLAFGTFNVVMVVARHESSTPISFPGTVRHVRVVIGAGDVTVVGRPGAESADVTGTRTVTRGLTSPSYQERVDGDTLVIESTCRAVFNWCSVAYSLSVPPSVTVDVESSSGDVVVRGIDGHVSVTSSSGDIQADAVDAIDAHARSGDITVTGADGPVVLSTSSGDISADSLAGPTADAEASSGDVTLGFGAAPTRVDARTSSGDVTIAVPAGDAFYRVITQTSSGTERVAVRQDPTGERQLSATTSSGDVVVTQAPTR